MTFFFGGYEEVTRGRRALFGLSPTWRVFGPQPTSLRRDLPQPTSSSVVACIFYFYLWPTNLCDPNLLVACIHFSKQASLPRAFCLCLPNLLVFCAPPTWQKNLAQPTTNLVGGRLPLSKPTNLCDRPQPTSFFLHLFLHLTRPFLK